MIQYTLMLDHPTKNEMQMQQGGQQDGHLGARRILRTQID